jgi:hypothetical protein
LIWMRLCSQSYKLKTKAPLGALSRMGCSYKCYIRTECPQNPRLAQLHFLSERSEAHRTHLNQLRKETSDKDLKQKIKSFIGAQKQYSVTEPSDDE